MFGRIPERGNQSETLYHYIFGVCLSQIFKCFKICDKYTKFLDMYSFFAYKNLWIYKLSLPRCKDRIATGQTTTTLMNNFQCLMINVHRLLPLKLYIDNQLFIEKQVCC